MIAWKVVLDSDVTLYGRLDAIVDIAMLILFLQQRKFYPLSNSQILDEECVTECCMLPDIFKLLIRRKYEIRLATLSIVLDSHKVAV